MAPELERLKKKYGEDKEAYAKAQMEIYKEMGVTPILAACPCSFRCRSGSRSIRPSRTKSPCASSHFCGGSPGFMTWRGRTGMITWDAHPLTIPFFGMRIVSLNILPILMAVAMYLQQKIQPMAPAATPEQASQQKMMRWMSLLFPILMYSMPSGLILYILTSTAIGVVESKANPRSHQAARGGGEGE